MLRALSLGALSGEIVLRASTAVYRQSAERYLTQQFPPETAFPKYRLLDDLRANRSLGAQLIDILASADTLTYSNLLTFYGNHLHLLLCTVPDSEALSLIETQRTAIQSLRDAIGSTFCSNASRRREMIADLMTRKKPLLPLPDLLQSALLNLVRVHVPGSTQPDAQRRTQMDSAVTYLATPLRDQMPELFSKMYAATDSSVTVGTTTSLFGTSDLSRYGTIDFVAGRIVGPTSENRGFITFSFFPTGPQERTPGGVDGRLALAIGVSVTGSGQDTTNYVFAGLTLRMNRYLSVTGGWVLPERTGKAHCCFVGFAGDFTALPFLKDLFVASGQGTTP
jgi:hypothetical protein